MMSIRCASLKRIRDVGVSSDNLLLFAVFVIALLWHLPDSLIAAPLTLFLVCLMTEGFSRFRMARLGVRPITEAQAPALVRMLQLESAKMGISQFTLSGNKTIYCVPRAAEATAFTLGGFGPKLVVTGRLCVAALSSPEEAQLVLRHELVHLGNRDMWLWQMLISAGVVAIPSLLQDPDRFLIEPVEAIKTLIMNVLAIPTAFASLLWLFRRREFLADAIALNHTDDRNRYLQLLKNAQLHRKSWFHPSPTDRIAALQCDCPVLRTNLPVLLMVASAFVACAFYAIRLSRGKIDLSVIAATVFGGLVFLAAFAVEIAKGPFRKTPLSLREDSFRPLPKTGYLSPLAELFGVGGDHLDAGLASALPTAVFASLVIDHLVRIAWWGPSWRDSYLTYGGWRTPLLSFLGWAIAWSILLLLLLRYARALTEVGAAMGLAITLYSFPWHSFHMLTDPYVLNDPSLRESAIADIAGIGLWFWSTLFGVICLGIVVARFRNAFIGLWLGDMCGSVVFGGLIYVAEGCLRQSSFNFHPAPVWDRFLVVREIQAAIQSATFAGTFILIRKALSRGPTKITVFHA
jgi:Zn-dependent protease with chaperone function